MISLFIPVAAAAVFINPSHTLGSTLPSVQLSEIIKKDMVGWDKERTTLLPELKQQEEQVQLFIRYRRGKMKPQEKLLWLAECIAQQNNPLLCSHKTKADRKETSEVPTPKPNSDAQRANIPQLTEALNRADLAAFHDSTESQVHKALRVFPNWEPLQQISDAALASSSCPSSSLLTALGLKAEEFFPEKKFRDLAQSFYSRAESCSTGETAEKARYRLSLLQIWNGQCTKADASLLKLSEQPNGNFVSRALYWRITCAKKSGNKMLAAALKGRLFKEYPLSYHAILLSRGTSVELVRLLDATEPSVSFRSEKTPELNEAIRTVEILYRQNADDLAEEILTSLTEQLAQAEPSFRLYAAILMGRSGDRIAQFRMLSELFRDDPKMISRSTLEMFYPLKRFDVLKSHGAKVDPYLVAALIRQESGFTATAQSPAGALGLMQLMPATARRMERVSKRSLFNPQTNVRLGVRYFNNLLSRYNADAELSLAAYNAGPERVDDWKRRYQTPNRMLFLDLIPYKETRDYVALISRNYYWYLSLYRDQQTNHTTSPRKPLVFTIFSSN